MGISSGSGREGSRDDSGDIPVLNVVDETVPKRGLSPETTLATRGRRSNPPCIASLALTRADDSKWPLTDSSNTTINASGQCCKIAAPRTAMVVSI